MRVAAARSFCRPTVVGEVGEDEAVAVNLLDLAVARELKLVGMDRLEPSGAAQLGDLLGAERMLFDPSSDHVFERR